MRPIVIQGGCWSKTPVPALEQMGVTLCYRAWHMYRLATAHVPAVLGFPPVPNTKNWMPVVSASSVLHWHSCLVSHLSNKPGTTVAAPVMFLRYVNHWDVDCGIGNPATLERKLITQRPDHISGHLGTSLRPDYISSITSSCATASVRDRYSAACMWHGNTTEWIQSIGANSTVSICDGHTLWRISSCVVGA